MNNFYRIFSATAAVQASAKIKGETPDSWEKGITDLLADLRHLCHRMKIDFAHCNELAQTHFETEQNEDSNMSLFQSKEEEDQ